MSGLKKTDPVKIALRRQREADAAAATAEYHATQVADREKTARLKALRLAKEAADRIAKPVASKSKPASNRR